MRLNLPSRLPYPQTPSGDTVEDYHGTPVADPYRWLEDEDAPGTAEWIEAQNTLTFSLVRAGDLHERLRARLTEVWDYPKYGVITREGDRHFFWKNEGLQNQPVLYMQPAALAAAGDEPIPVLDPNTLSPDGTAAVTGQAWTPDGRLLGYSLSRAGSDWQELRVRDLDSREDLPDAIQWCKFTSPAWSPDGSGFFYARYPDPGTVPPGQESFNQTVHWHALGTAQDADPLLYSRPDAPELGFSPSVTDDGRYLVLTVWKGTDPKNRVYFRELDGGPDFVRLLDVADARYDFVDNVGSVFYFTTDLDAPRGRVIAIDVTRPARAQWREVIPEPEGQDTIDTVALVNDHLVVVTMHHAHHRITLYTLDGTRVRDVALPGIGSVSGLSGKREQEEFFLAFTSFLHPTTVLRYHVPTDQLETVFAPQLPFDVSGYETRQVFYTSKDGTQVPLFLTHKKGLMLEGNTPTLLYGYGGFNVSLTPSFSPARLAWLEQGGVFALANLRGGGEYGEAWHQAGAVLNKQNVFDDFIAAAEWLVANGYTRPERLAIQGGSNGGLLVAACLLQRLELFGAVVCQVPVADMLRYHRFTVGRFWVSDYGNAREDPEHFRYMLRYSPVHNCRLGARYPATLITTADHDDRVAPAHAKKFAAALQAAQAGDAPILLRVETQAGHGAGKPTAKLIEEQADLYAFLFKALGVQID
ncbi:MAG: Prolyl endopeptidase [uncultured Chloroflexi bacterium]|uniref:prolyl oligopeptidase n=1 Tax=uncultured Chloroflexota bacterium TaxID=166587 RepID=A0A6J4HVM4_9CHLR|nr:MAG: Prolyl endopeptidase [uncultured Chloroflexota bacterium]